MLFFQTDCLLRKAGDRNGQPDLGTLLPGLGVPAQALPQIVGIHSEKSRNRHLLVIKTFL